MRERMLSFSASRIWVGLILITLLLVSCPSGGGGGY
jgi:hypothetical protein